ncbi:MAG: protein-disulfide reductase DsbD domain-containing protein, partial [Planctomycetota bacterium]|nr:protein-disulfide reductase DsbD domain-containing protein [Planctomycetota bacterium]
MRRISPTSLACGFAALLTVGAVVEGTTPPSRGVGGGLRFGVPGEQEPLAPSDGDRLVQLKVIAPDEPVRPGGTALLGIRLRIAPKWHVYWRNPGESGAAPKVTISGSTDVVAGTIRWPRPVVFRGGWDTTYGYADEVTLLQPVRISAETPSGPLSLKVDVEWLVCKEACLLGEGTRLVVLEIGKPTAAEATPKPAIQAALDRVPRELSSLSGASAALDFEADPPILRVQGPTGGATDLGFLPDLTPGVTAGG